MPLVLRPSVYLVQCSGACGRWLSTACTAVDSPTEAATFGQRWGAMKAAYEAGWAQVQIGGPGWQDPVCPSCDRCPR